jgi:hypothetical protein
MKDPMRVPQKPLRTLTIRLQKSVRVYATAVGELVWASNFCHSRFQLVFSSLIGTEDLDVGDQLWHSMGSDKAQRGALRALAQKRLPAGSRLLRNVLWAVERGDRLGEQRNDAVHMPTAWMAGYVLIPDPTGNPRSRLDRMGKLSKPMAEHYRFVRGDLIALAWYAHGLFCHLAYQTDQPRRPRLSAAAGVGRTKKPGGGKP